MSLIINPYRFGSGSAADPTALSIYNKLTSWWEMDELSGTRNDSKGSNHLSVTGTVTTASGVRGTDVAAAFAGSGALSVASNSTIQVPSGGGNHCWFAWVYLTSNSGTQALMGKWDAATSSGLEYHLDLSSGNFRAINGGAGYNIAQTTAPTAATWHFCVCWRDSADGKVRLQIDGGTVIVSANASNPNPSSNPLAFGRSAGYFSLTGRLQRCGFIKGAILDSTERAYLYSSASGVTWTELATAAGH